MEEQQRTVKEELHRLVDLLPEADGVAMINDLASRIWILRRVYQGEADVAAGRGYTVDQVREMIAARMSPLEPR